MTVYLGVTHPTSPPGYVTNCNNPVATLSKGVEGGEGVATYGESHLGNF